MKATLEVQKAVFLSVCVYILHKVGTVIVQSLHADYTKVCTNFAIHQQLVSIKIKFKLSSSQEPTQCLFFFSSEVKILSEHFLLSAYHHSFAPLSVKSHWTPKKGFKHFYLISILYQSCVWIESKTFFWHFIYTIVRYGFISSVHSLLNFDLGFHNNVQGILHPRTEMILADCSSLHSLNIFWFTSSLITHLTLLGNPVSRAGRIQYRQISDFAIQTRRSR